MNLRLAAQKRILPFAAFMLLLALRGLAAEHLPAELDARWLYTLQAGVAGALLLWWWRSYGELARQNLPTAREVLASVGLGLLVFVLWISLDAPWMQLSEPSATFLPLDLQGQLIWPLVITRWIGAALIVPVMEELFWRSFLMRWLEEPNFEAVPVSRVSFRAIILSTFVFTLAHTLWLAAILAGLAYAMLYKHTGKLWTAVIAHAVTNGALGIWVVTNGRWEFW
jgi:CAAX prenyl protease-like protein